MKVIERSTLLSSCREISGGIYELRILCPQIAKEAKPGQFIQLYPDNGANLLARPISICEIEDDLGLRMVFQVVGKGTERFSWLIKHDPIRVLGPCGNGFELKDGSAMLVGGGIGVPPMFETAKQLIAKGIKPIAVLGFRSGSFLADEFEKIGAEVHIATDDGTVGFKGNVVDLIRAKGIKAEHVYACGPKVMLKFLSLYCEEQGMDVQVSMEERMACGIGACVGCVVKIKDETAEDGWTYKKVCKDGPVFDSKAVIWE